jgi:hypothetical protein
LSPRRRGAARTQAVLRKLDAKGDEKSGIEIIAVALRFRSE